MINKKKQLFGLHVSIILSKTGIATLESDTSIRIIDIFTFFAALPNAIILNFIIVMLLIDTKTCLVWLMKCFFLEDWTGPINYFRKLPYIRLNTSSSEPISTQTLLLIGNMDPSVTLESIVQSSEYIEKVSVKVVPGAYHFPHQEKPDLVNQAIMKFLVGKLFHTIFYEFFHFNLCSR